LRRATLFILLNFITSLVVIGVAGKLSPPEVRLSRTGQMNDPITGLLWTHTETYWYVFDAEKSILRGIPDKNVRLVRIWRGEDEEDAPKSKSCIAQ
jgi:hypothetical protein